MRTCTTNTHKRFIEGHSLQWKRNPARRRLIEKLRKAMKTMDFKPPVGKMYFSKQHDPDDWDIDVETRLFWGDPPEDEGMK